MITTGGANVSPVEIDNALVHHPGLASALAVGVPHPPWARRWWSAPWPGPGRRWTRPRCAPSCGGIAEDELVLTANAEIRADERRRLAAARPGTGTLAPGENTF